MNILRFIPRMFSKIQGKELSGIQKTIAEHLAKNPEAANKTPFCQQYWGEICDLKFYRRISGNVTHHGYLNGINHHLLWGINPEGLRKPFMYLGVTPHEMIQLTDAEMRALPKTKETIIAYRCIGRKPEFLERDFAKYQKSLNVKEGDIVVMPEYAYATSDINYAHVYLPNNKGIRYVIEIEPESQVSVIGNGKDNEIVFPRCSKFICKGVNKLGDTTEIMLRHIKPINYIG